MADHNNFLDIIPDDITGYLVQFLTVQELATFKQLCKQFNFIGSHAVFLQPLYNRLYAIDKTLSPTFTTENAPLEFKQAFEKIRDRQNEEIAFLITINCSPNPRVLLTPQALDLLSSMLTACNIEQLEKRDAILNALNTARIKKLIFVQPGRILDLSSCLTRFFITEEHVEYFKNLTTLICSNNLFTCISLNNHPKLELLDCRNNPSLKEIHLLGCSKSLEVKCDHDEEKPINIFCNNYDYSQMFKNIGKAAVYGFSNPGVAGALLCLEIGKIGKELYHSYNTQPPPKVFIDDLGSQDKKAKFLYIEEVQLFEQLKKETSDSKRSEIIVKLGDDRYNTQNCLKHGCLYEAGLIASNQASSILEKTSNFFLSFMKSEKKEDVTMTKEGSLKRKRDESSEDDERNNKKKHKKPGG